MTGVADSGKWPSPGYIFGLLDNHSFRFVPHACHGPGNARAQGAWEAPCGITGCLFLAVPDHGAPQDLADGGPPVRVAHQEFNNDTENVNWNMMRNAEICSQSLLPQACRRASLERNMPGHHEVEEHP